MYGYYCGHHEFVPLSVFFRCSLLIYIRPEHAPEFGACFCRGQHVEYVRITLCFHQEQRSSVHLFKFWIVPTGAMTVQLSFSGGTR